MKALMILSLLLLPIAVFGQGTSGQTCEPHSTTLNLNPANASDNTEHRDGQHSVATGLPLLPGPSQALQGTCTYKTGAGANCDTLCKVSASGFTESEQGTLN